VLGDQFGYVFGRRLGPALSGRPDSRLFNQDNLTRTQSFFERYGARSIVPARFIPIVRTFTPIVAGASRMPRRTFLSNLELILIGIVAVSVIPVGIELLRERRRYRRDAANPG
jgi:membrane-associated protein